MVDTLSFSALLLAAGRSTRMGRDKALLPIESTILWRRQWDLLAAVGAADRWLSVRAEQDWVPPEMPVVRDVLPAAGPLAGIAAALEKIRGTHLIVLAVDLPRMDAAWFERLKTRCVPGVGAAGWRDGFYEPLAAIYPRELAAPAVSALIRGEYALQRFIVAAGPAMQSVEIGEAEAPWFANWNESGDVTGL